mmetsp:Transcript_42840/g.81717  ORF Transcript_42840/g.81717 Transcript_42840/m.81717 type:complete len:272 (+) Transcript_42840:93-908(+)
MACMKKFCIFTSHNASPKLNVRSRRAFRVDANRRTAKCLSASSTDVEYTFHHLSGNSSDLQPWVNRLGKFEVGPAGESSRFVVPARITYEQDGDEYLWDMVHSFPSVSVALYHRDLHAAVIVRQFRPAVYASQMAAAEKAGLPKPPLSGGFTYELCAGLADKESKSLAQTASEELLEECGYNVPVDTIHEITSYCGAIGISGCLQTIFASEVDESMRVSEGGGLHVDGEAIQVLALKLSDVDNFLADSSAPKSAGLMYALMWMKLKYVHDI